MTPGKAHKEFANNVGKWNVTVTMYNTGSPEPMVTEGTAVMEVLLGGRYLQSKFTAVMMGMPFEGMSLDAYDNALDEYSSIWIDNMGTGVFISKGKWNLDTKKLELVGDMVDPVSKTGKKTYTVIDYESKDSMHQKMYTMEGDKKILMMEMKYSRAK